MIAFFKIPSGCSGRRCKSTPIFSNIYSVTLLSGHAINTSAIHINLALDSQNLSTTYLLFEQPQPPPALEQLAWTIVATFLELTYVRKNGQLPVQYSVLLTYYAFCPLSRCAEWLRRLLSRRELRLGFYHMTCIGATSNFAISVYIV